jgi:hypothetical protein
MAVKGRNDGVEPISFVIYHDAAKNHADHDAPDTSIVTVVVAASDPAS